MIAYQDIKIVDELISERVSKGSWVIAPSSVSRLLGWSLSKSVEILGEIHRQQVHATTTSMVAICDYCHSETLVDALAAEIIDDKEPFTLCESCGQAFPCSADNTRISLHVKIKPSTSNPLSKCRKEESGGPNVDTRQ